MEINDIIQSWQEQSADDLRVAEDMFATKHYAPCLFFLHLAIEKLLKASAVQTLKAPAPYTHDLVTLAQVAEITLEADQQDYLREVNTFNIRARYDDYKREFYKRATADFTVAHLDKAKTFITWLHNLS